MYRKRADGVGDEERLTTADGVAETPQAVSPDGRWLVFTRLGGPGGGDILALDLTAPAGTAPRPIVATPEFDGSSRISPDGRWIVYASNGTTGSNIYVQAFPDAGPVYPVSTEGGTEPLWSRDGREIFYVPPSRDGLMVAKVTPGPVFSVSQPRMLFTGHYKSSVHSSTGYDVAADGRFLRIRESVVERALTGIEITLNWPAGLSATGARR